MLQTLVLNIAETPVAVVPYRRVLSRVCNNLAVVKRHYENTLIRSSGGIEMPIPSVVQCIKTNYIPKFTKVLPFNRKNLYIRDRGCCAYCEKKLSLNSMTFDHVIPRAQGGFTCWTNVVLACFKCNSKKGARHPNQYKWPKIKPYAPRLSQAAPVQLVNKIASDIIEKTWEDYIYWEIVLEK
jgi:5-methylcytosine-specific restriction endonuclease McrA